MADCIWCGKELSKDTITDKRPQLYDYSQDDLELGGMFIHRLCFCEAVKVILNRNRPTKLRTNRNIIGR